MRRALNPVSFFLPATLTALLFATVWTTKPLFFQHLITGKQWGVEQVGLLVAAFLVISLPFFRSIRISIVDAGIFLLLAWWIMGESFLQTTHFSQETLFFHAVLWGTVYIFLRSTGRNSKMLRVTIVVFLITALSQSILGLLQLYGFEASHHGLFKITGTFHNPGPFSGFVVSALPLALVGCTERHGGDKEIHKEIPPGGVKFNFSPQKIFSGVLRALSLLTIIAVLLIVPAAQSRAAWLAGAIGCLYVLLVNRERFPLIKRLSDRFKRLSLLLKSSLITVALIFILGGATGLYLFKKDSANGRLLIWQVTSQLIKERPITGHGSGAFSALYMNEQANWFESGKGNETQAMVAASPEVPFNEVLKLWLEKGLFGLILAGGIVWIIFFPGTFNSKLKTRNSEPLTSSPTPPHPLKGEPRTRVAKTQNPEPGTQNPELETRNTEPGTQNPELETRNTEHGTRNPEPETQNPEPGTRNTELKILTSGLKGTLITILTFSLFSYPFDISSFVLLLVVLVALLAPTTPELITIKGRKSLLLTLPFVVLLIAAGFWYFPKRQAHYAAMKTWHEADQLYNMRSYDTASEAYEEAFPTLKNNGLFLQMQGKALSMNEQYGKSNEILNRARKRYSSYIIYNTLGNNHKALGNLKKAEAAYKKSSNMVPVLLLPKYLLAKLYKETGQNLKAKQTAKEILNSPVKVKSTATNEIMKEMKNLLTQSNTEKTQSSTEIKNNPL